MISNEQEEPLVEGKNEHYLRQKGIRRAVRLKDLK